MNRNLTSFHAVYRPQNLSFGEMTEALPYFHDLTAGGGLYVGEVREAASYRDTGQPDGRNRVNAHGYDVVADRVSDSLGGITQLEGLFGALDARNMPCILDGVFHHSSDQHEGRTETGRQNWDQVQLADGTTYEGNFFGYGWLPRYQQDTGVLLGMNRTLVDLAVKHGAMLRLDHPDGLDDPIAVQTELARLGLETWWEKILTKDWETIPNQPGLNGDTGYRGLDLINRLLHAGDGVAQITAAWQARTGERRTFDEVDRACRQRAARDFTLQLRRAIEGLNGDGHMLSVDRLVQAVATSPVYRPYTVPGREWTAQDGRIWDEMDLPDPIRQGVKAGRHPLFVRHLQATLPAIIAKGREDNAFYAFSAVLGLNEVGGSRHPLGRQQFHELATGWVGQFPHSLWDSQTHDCKRCLRLRCASAFNTHNAGRYLAVIDAILKLAEKHNRDGSLSPQAVWFIADEAMGVWPADVQLGQNSRFLNYLRSAFRQGRTYTGWRPGECSEEWESKMLAFAVAFCTDGDVEELLVPHVSELKRMGLELSLSQQLLTLMIGNKAVIYHGSEGAECRRLMDPWNREAVDYGALHTQLRNLQAGGEVTDGNRMMNLIWLTLAARRAHGGTDTMPEFLDVKPGVVAVRRGKLVAVASHVPDVPARLPRFDSAEDLLGGNYRGQKLYRIH